MSGAYYTPASLLTAVDPAAGTAGYLVTDLAAVAAAETRNLHPCECGKGVKLWGASRGTPACSCNVRKFAAIYGHFPSHETWTDINPEGAP